MKKCFLLFLGFLIVGCEDTASDSAASPSLPGSNDPCIECDSTQGRQTYSGFYIANSLWEQEVDVSTADLTSSSLVQASGQFFQTEMVGSTLDQVWGVNEPFCGSGFDRDKMYIWFSDEWDSSAFKFVHLQSNNQVHIYTYNPNFTLTGSTATVDSELNTVWDCDEGVLKRTNDNTGNEEFLAANESFGYMLYNTWSGPLYEISMSAVPADLSDLTTFDVFFDIEYDNAGYDLSSSFVYVNSSNVNPVQYDTTGLVNDVNTVDMESSFLGTGGDLGYIFRAGETFTHRSSFVVIKGLQDKDLVSRDLIMGIFSPDGFVEQDPLAPTSSIDWSVVYGMSL